MILKQRQAPRRKTKEQNNPPAGQLYCLHCGEYKDESHFIKSNTTYCRKCRLEINTEFRRYTTKGIANKIYHAQKNSSILRGHPAPTYNHKDFHAWLIAQPNFDAIVTAWQNSGFDIKLSPSVDRLNDYIGYKLSNIRLVTWQENKDKSCEDTRNGINNKRSYHTVQLCMDTGKEIARYHSAAAAGRALGIPSGNISKVCRGERPSYFGYAWKAIEMCY